MKRIYIIAGAGLGLILLGAMFVPFIIPNDVYKQQIEQAATSALGRNVSVQGTVRLSVFPQISATVDGVTVANPDGFSRENMVEAGRLRGVVRWTPLLSGKVEVAEITFVDADVMLERREDGAVNWEFTNGASEPEPEPEESGGSGVGFDAGIDTARLQNATLVYADAVSGAEYALSELDLSASLQALDAPLSAELTGLFQGTRFDVDLDLDAPQSLLDGAPASVALALDTEGGGVSYTGTAAMTDSINLDGAFSVDGRNLTQLATLAGVDIPINLAALGRLSATGQVSGPVEAARVQFDNLSLGGSGLSGRYSGDVLLGDQIGLEGRLDVESGNLGGWLGDLGLELPGSISVLERLDVQTRLSGPVETLSLQDTTLSHQGRLLDASFAGSAQIGEDSNLAGRLEASSTRLRDLMETLDIEMAEGDTLEQFSVSGDVAGSLTRIAVSDLDAQLDDIGAKGDLTLVLDGPRPALAGDLNTGTLDLSPFLTEGDEATPQTDGGWSDEPLDLSGLKAVDADISLKAESIILGDITLDAPDLSAVLDNGDLTATIATMRAFGGEWTGAFDLGASEDIPTMGLDLTGETIQLSDALLSLAGLDALSGIGQLRVDVNSQGNSLKSLVEGLSGEMGSNVADGAIKGVNVGQLVRSRDTLLQSLTDGSLQMALAPEAETDFTSLLAGLTLENGVASLDAFNLANPVLSLEGSGTIDLGARTMDVGIVPRLDTTGQGGGSAVQLNGIPIPFRIRGDWLAPGMSPDTQMIQSILRQEAESEARAALQDNVGGELGGLLDGVLGTRSTSTNPDSAPSSDAVPAEAQDTEEVIEDLARDAARDALGSLFGNRRQQEEDEEETDD
ncbi:MAG: AsmA family protein [Pseudomonadota bacterium]